MEVASSEKQFSNDCNWTQGKEPLQKYSWGKMYMLGALTKC